MNHTSLKITLIASLLLCGNQSKALLREFELKDGRKVRAEIINYDSRHGQVSLRRDDGKVVRVKASIFMAEDHSYISNWKKPPKGVVPVPAGTNSGTDPEFGEYSITETGFYMDQHEVTLELWEKVYEWATAHGYEFDNPGHGKGGKHPVHTISWYDCVKWCNARSEMEKRIPCYTVGGKTFKTGQETPECAFDANGFRLPTCKEREYACRGGLTGKRFPWGNMISHKKANYNAGSSSTYDESAGCHPKYKGARDEMPYTSPVGSFPPNNFGLFDLVGNVNEFCWDQKGNKRITHGCSWGSRAEYGMCGYMKDSVKPDFTYRGLGFRAVCK